MLPAKNSRDSEVNLYYDDMECRDAFGRPSSSWAVLLLDIYVATGTSLSVIALNTFDLGTEGCATGSLFAFFSTILAAQGK